MAGAVAWMFELKSIATMVGKHNMTDYEFN